MACGEPQWWYDLVNQELADQQVLNNFFGKPLFENVRDIEICKEIECITAADILDTLNLDTISEDDIVTIHRVDEDTPEAAYERAMKGI